MLFFYAWVVLLLAITLSVPLVQFLENRKRRAAQAAAKPVGSDADMGMGMDDDMGMGGAADGGMNLDDDMGGFGDDAGMAADDFLDSPAPPR